MVQVPTLVPAVVDEAIDVADAGIAHTLMRTWGDCHEREGASFEEGVVKGVFVAGAVFVKVVVAPLAPVRCAEPMFLAPIACKQPLCVLELEDVWVARVGELLIPHDSISVWWCTNYFSFSIL